MENYNLLMSDYIAGSSIALKNHINNTTSNTIQLINLLDKNKHEKIILVACGSSLNASFCAIEAMKKILKVPVEIISPFTFVNYHTVQNNEFILVISQSGNSTNSIEALEFIKKSKQTAIGITASCESDFKNHSDVLIDYKNGEEKCLYVTKGVVILTAFLIEFSLELSLKLKQITSNEYDNYLNELKKVPSINAQVYKKTEKFITKNYKKLTNLNIVYSIGANSGLHIAYESALKLGETLKIPSFSYEVEEFIHGPNLQLTPNYSLFFFDVNDISSSRIETIIKASHTITDKCFVITNNKNLHSDTTLLVDDDLMSCFKPMAYLPFVQLIASQVATDTNKWEKHPLYKEFTKIAKSKVI